MDSVVPSRVDVLVIGSHAPELRGLRTHLGERLYGTVRGLHVAGKTVGVGLAVAGGATAKRVFQLHPRGVIHLGSCGVYPGLSDCQPHDMLVATKITLFDPSVQAGSAAFPAPMLTELETDPMLTAGIASSGSGARQVKVASTLARTTDEALAASIPSATGCYAESLESFAIAHACKLAQIPFTALLSASHVVGPRGQKDWSRFERDSTIRAADALVAWLNGGAQGLPHG